MFSAVLGLSALFHDLGKASHAFQKKLESSEFLADAVRHELISALLVLKVQEQALLCHSVPLVNANTAILAILADPEAAQAALSKAWNAVASDLLAEAGNATLPRLRAETGGDLGMAVALLCLGHHKLPSSETVGALQKRFLKPGTYIRLHDVQKPLGKGASRNARRTAASLESGLKLSDVGHAPWHSAAWLRNVATFARQLQAANEEQIAALESAFALMGRFLLQAADHSSTAHAAAKMPPRSRRGMHSHSHPISRIGGMKPAFVATLDNHLRSVAFRASDAGANWQQIRATMPALSGSDLPAMIARPNAPPGSRFGWQVDAAEAAARIVEPQPDDPSGRVGFFGVLAAGTGAGKTVAAPIMLSAAAGGRLRYVMALGLRTLTLQTADEYIGRIGMPPNLVRTAIGSLVAGILHGLDLENDTAAGNSSLAGADDSATLSLEVEGRIVGDKRLDADLPLVIRRFALAGGELPRSMEAAAMLAAPILVCTVDTVIGAADRRFGRHLSAMARICTSDLILDEIDDYGPEDLVALCRLVHVVGAGGGRVIVSSATMTASLATEIFRSYRDGLAIHVAMTGQAPYFAVPCCYATDATGAQSAFLAGDAKAYGQQLTLATTAAVASIRSRPPVRSADCVEVASSVSEPDFHGRIVEGIRRVHADHRQKDPKTTILASAGVVRFSNVASAASFAMHLLERPAEDDLELVVVPYFGTLLAPVRHQIERTLDRMLKRACSGPAEDPLFGPVSPMRARLDTCASANLAIVVVTTSMEEVGRDHDFDWAISEISTARGLVQLAGRVRRHRRFAGTKTANVLILDAPKKQLQKSWGKLPKGANVLAFPGIETSYQGREAEEAHLEVSAAPYETDSLIDIDRWRVSIDAAEFVDPAVPRSRLARLERERLHAFLAEGLGRPWLTSRYASESRSLWTANHAASRIFRRSEDEILLVANPYASHIDGYSWSSIRYEGMDRASASRSNKDGVIGCLDLAAASMRRLLVPLGYEETRQLYEDLLSRVEPIADPRDEASKHLLMTLTVPASKAGRVRPSWFHPSLGIWPR